MNEYSVELQRQSYRQASSTSTGSSACLWAAFAMLGKPTSLLDVGCGDGHLVDLAASCDVNSHGLDLFAPARERLEVHDLATPWRGSQYDMVLCLEVAEHLFPDAADTLCETLVAAMNKDAWLLFSAAVPGQGGSGHYNEQPYDYWRRRLESLGLHWYEESSRVLARLWSHVASETWWYGQNIQLFSKRSIA